MIERAKKEAEEEAQRQADEQRRLEEEEREAQRQRDDKQREERKQASERRQLILAKSPKDRHDYRRNEYATEYEIN